MNPPIRPGALDILACELISARALCNARPELMPQTNSMEAMLEISQLVSLATAGPRARALLLGAYELRRSLSGCMEVHAVRIYMHNDWIQIRSCMHHA